MMSLAMRCGQRLSRTGPIPTLGLTYEGIVSIGKWTMELQIIRKALQVLDKEAG
jgi:hypothetical protein